ncbi:hypothetical protein BV898_13372 [Hypsibius exemplaris]|uniref:Uncharacterized protein n=1 Tax=Hypsibius exemplaris TaxID=2072580 RepID=A0A1W0WAV9_HYPEX|nr:hypothetical protein BV898_13372 [Hypsibius exemplaris]
MSHNLLRSKDEVFLVKIILHSAGPANGAADSSSGARLPRPDLSGNGREYALLYHRSAYEEAIRKCNLQYSELFHFTMTFLPDGSRSRAQTNPEMRDSSMDELSEWYFKNRLN